MTRNRNLIILLLLLGGVVALTGILILSYRQPAPEIRRIAGKSSISDEVRLAADNLEQGKILEAEKNLRLALSKNPADEVAIRMLGRIYFETGRYAEAEKMFLVLIDLNSNDASAYNNLGQTLFRQGKTTEALNALKTSISLKPDSALAHFNISWIYSISGEKELAQYHYEQSRQLLEKYQQSMEEEEEELYFNE